MDSNSRQKRNNHLQESIQIPIQPYIPKETSADTIYNELHNSESMQTMINDVESESDDKLYPNWAVPDVPVPCLEINSIFTKYENKYGFQRDNVRNMYDHLMTMLNSRSARMSPRLALWTLHADYIGGENANYRKWYFAAQLDLDDRHTPNSATELLLEEAKREWRENMEGLSDHTRTEHLALYLLIWGEASTLRYTPELLCFIYYTAESYKESPARGTCTSFLDSVISPLYNYMRDQSYQILRGHYVRRERDHNIIVGYDDINQLFWDRRTIAGLQLKKNGLYLKDIPKEYRFLELKNVDWDSAFSKTFYESRSWFHLVTNFSRIWIIHATSFWYYMASNADFLYSHVNKDGKKSVNLPAKLSIIGLGGLVAIVLIFFATIAEFKHLKLDFTKLRLLLFRVLILVLIGLCHVAISFYILRYNQTSTLSLVLASCQLGVGAIISIVIAIMPPSSLFHRRKSSRHLTCKTFTANFPSMTSGDRFLSLLLWICIFSCKFLETYFFLALSFHDALITTVSMNLKNCSMDPWLGRWLCGIVPVMTTVLMLSVEFVLFFLDTYLWYVIWSTIFSVSQSMKLGISVMSSWRTLFAKVPRNMFTKITATKDFVSVHLRRMACSQMWNAIVISMYKDHLISLNNLQSLLYQVQVTKDDQGDMVRELQVPSIFDMNSSNKMQEYFPSYSEAERRLSFFAQSLSTSLPSPCSVGTMPTFTVFTPHYSEKILLSLREIIREEDSTTRLTLLEYLKKLHPTEWDNFVTDTKFISGENEMVIKSSEKDDLPFYCIGFKSSAPEYTLRTRLWASLRAQTLYRTINGFMNYARALKVLYRIEHPDFIKQQQQPGKSKEQQSDGDTGNNNNDREEMLDRLAHQKFRYLVAMQRYAKFNDEELANCEYLLREHPNLQIAYIDEKPASEQDNANKGVGGEEEEQKTGNGNGNGDTGESTIYYSVLIDGHCDLLKNNRRAPKYRIRLPGNPILGDGKSDNQNHALIFYRGEYLQLVDANQDNYLEECIKIRSIFGEFEQESSTTAKTEEEVYALYSNTNKMPPPVAIVGAREYIFSENVGMLGDVAAGKEQTFGTLTQRIMAKVGGRLHYGHPDFLNAVFMTTRGGVSKAQRGLHLNEDIYAGMNALLRGGRIKHTEYLQCGKGRDLGFCSILNFTTKIGGGMGEQLLSREYYYLGTQLPLDRFLTFYYAHPGFHVNNIMIMFAVQLFLFCMTLVGTMAASLPLCKDDNCFNFRPVSDWLHRCILSIFVVFFISFLPLFLQELTEKGTKRSIWRLIKQLISFSALFEVFVTQIYANAVLSNLSFGGARYIATGRGFATSRIPFSVLYSRFANQSIYFGARTMFILLFVSLALWIPHLIYFWITVSALVISPFVFNPHQFVLTHFIYDYREFLGWLSRGNSTRHYEHSWISFCRNTRTQVTGNKKKARQDSTINDNRPVAVVPRARLSNMLYSEIVTPFVQCFLFVACYVFYKSREEVDRYGTLKTQVNSSVGPWGALGRLLLIVIGPIVWNAIMLLFVQILSVLLSWLKRTGFYMSLLAHGLAIIGFVVFFEIFWVMEKFQIKSTVLGLLSIFSIQRFVFKTFVAIFMTRELHHDATNRAWWSGKWIKSKVGHLAAREYVCKIVEMTVFTTDFIMGHLILFLLFPFTLIPSVDKLHSLILFWIRPSKQIRPSVLTTKERKQRRRVALVYGPLFIFILSWFVILIILPPHFITILPIKYQTFVKII